MDTPEPNYQDYSNILTSWTFNEYEVHQRSGIWYVIFGIIIALIVGLSIFTQNFLFVVIILLSTVILFLQNSRDPEKISFALTTDGLEVGSTKIRMKEIDEFWIVYQPPHVKKLYFSFQSSLRPVLGVDLEDQDPLQLRALLLQYLPENLDTDDEPTTESIARLLKL